MILNCVVIDDDPEALNQITSHIKRTPTLQLIGAYNQCAGGCKRREERTCRRALPRHTDARTERH